MKKYGEIVIVDDDLTNNLICERILKNAGIAENVLSFVNIIDGLDYLKIAVKNNLIPDVLLLDIYFPLEDGWNFMQVFEEIFVNQAEKPQVFILSSSIANKDMMQAQANRYITDFIVKPLNEAKLMKYFA